MHVGPFEFDIPGDFRIRQGMDTIFIESDDALIKVVHGNNLMFSVFDPWHPTGINSTDNERIALRKYFPCRIYPDSFPPVIHEYKFDIRVDSVIRIYDCKSDSSAEIVAVHNSSGAAIHFLLSGSNELVGFTSSMISQSIHFMPDKSHPMLLEFSYNDTAMHCCGPDTVSNLNYGKILVKNSDTIMECWVPAKFENTVVEELTGTVKVDSDSIILGYIPGLYRLDYFEENSRILLVPPGETRLQCDCYTCYTLYYKIHLPKLNKKHSLHFDGKVVGDGEMITIE